jgi:hypothetical protein
LINDRSAFIMKPPIEALELRVLRGLSWLGENRRHAVVMGACIRRQAGEFRAVIDAKRYPFYKQVEARRAARIKAACRHDRRLHCAREVPG